MLGTFNTPKFLLRQLAFIGACHSLLGALLVSNQLSASSSGMLMLPTRLFMSLMSQLAFTEAIHSLLEALLVSHQFSASSTSRMLFSQFI